MKSLFFLFAALGILFSCSKKETNPEGLAIKFDSGKFPQEWQLVSMQGNVANIAAVTGSQMSWQESYLFNADNTFSKTRERDGVTKTISGKFSSKEIGTEKYLELTNQAESDLIGNCYSTPTEELFIKSDSELASTWQACDGPGLVYNRIK